MRVLVFGGREYGFRIDQQYHPNFHINQGQVKALFAALDEIHAVTPIDELAEGGAPGADFLAGVWAASRGVRLIEFQADWKTHGSSAGPIRNQQQSDWAPDLAVQLPGGSGTRDMRRRLDRAGVKVIQV